MIAGKFNIKEYYTRHEIMTKWNVSNHRINALRKKIETRRVGIRIFYKRTDVDYLMRNLPPTGYLTMKEARLRLRLNQTTLYRWRLMGRIDLVRTDKHWICLESEVDRLLAERGRWDNYVYGFKNIAVALNTNPATVTYWIRTGKLKLEKYHGRVRLHEDIISEFTTFDHAGMIPFKEAAALLGTSYQPFYDYRNQGLIHGEKRIVGGHIRKLYSLEDIMKIKDGIEAEKARLKATKVTAAELCDLFDKCPASINIWLKRLGIEWEAVSGCKYYDREYTITMMGVYIRRLESLKERKLLRETNAAPSY